MNAKLIEKRRQFAEKQIDKSESLKEASEQLVLRGAVSQRPLHEGLFLLFDKDKVKEYKQAIGLNVITMIPFEIMEQQPDNTFKGTEQYSPLSANALGFCDTTDGQYIRPDDGLNLTNSVFDGLATLEDYTKVPEFFDKKVIKIVRIKPFEMENPTNPTQMIKRRLIAAEIVG